MASRAEARLGLITSVCAKLASAGRIEDHLSYLVQEVCRVLEADACVIRELSQDSLVLLDSFGVPASVLAKRHSAQEGLAGEMIRSGRPVAVVHVDDDPLTRALSSAAERDPAHFRFKSYGGAPMFSDGRIKGVLGVYMTRAPRVFDQADLDALQILANAAAIRLANDRLFAMISEAAADTRMRVARLLEDADGSAARAAIHSRDDQPLPGAAAARVDRDVKLEYDLRRSAGQIIPYFQPLVCGTDGKLAGYELLARWNHPEEGLLLPRDFIPIALRTGMIAEIGMRLAHTAVETLADGLPECVADIPPILTFNASSIQLTDRSFVPAIVQLLDNAKVRRNALVVEVTEHDILTPHTVQAESIIDLSEKGIPVFLDDFGAGYSSLSHLVDFPLAGVKIDRHLLPTGPHDQRRQMLLRSMTSLARDFRLRVVVEGIESDYQREFACSLGVDLLQGFGIGRPSPLRAHR